MVAVYGGSAGNAAEISRRVSEINPFGRPRVNGSDYNNYTAEQALLTPALDPLLIITISAAIKNTPRRRRIPGSVMYIVRT